MFAQTGLRISRYHPHATMAPHRHDEPSMNIVVNGDFLERIGRGERDYARGHAAFCPAGTTHSQTFGKAGAMQIIFRPQDSWLDYLADCKTRLDEAPYASSNSLRTLGDRLVEEMRNDDGFSTIACEGLLLEIVAAFGRTGAPKTAGVKPPVWLCTARDFIHENAFMPLSMAKIARQAGRHEIHLAREFRRFFGVSVGTYLRRLRTEHAATLLLRPWINISEVAQDSGFASHSHLCREFKAYFGVTPSQFRSRNL
jgi:AraC family transcriptional regulator